MFLWISLLLPAVAPGTAAQSINITFVDLTSLADIGVIASYADAQRIWAALRAKQQSERPAADGNAEHHEPEANGMVGAMHDLRRLLSMTNLLYCIATALLTAVFTFLMWMFRKNHSVQAAVAVCYAIVFLYWGLQLMSLGSVSAVSGGRLIGGLLLLMPNISALVVGCAIVEAVAGSRWPDLYNSWYNVYQRDRREAFFNNIFNMSILVLALCVMVCSGGLYALSSFPVLLVPLFASVYLVICSLSLMLSQQLTMIIWGSLAHSAVLWGLAHVEAITPDLRLGLLISACNSGCWSLPYLLCLAPLGFGTDAGAARFQGRLEHELWGSPTFQVCFGIYATVNIALLHYGLRLQSWVPVPYALMGIILTMAVANHAPPRVRMAWRLLYNLPVAVLLFAVGSAYSRITDTLWLGILSWLGDPQHFRVVAIFVVRAVTLLSAIWSLWFGLSRLFPSRLQRDLKGHIEVLQREATRFQELPALLEKATSKGTADEQRPTRSEAKPGWFSRVLRRSAPETPGDDDASMLPAGDVDELRSELLQLQKRQAWRDARIATVQQWDRRIEVPGRMALGSLPLCWVGYCLSAALCDAPEPFLLLRLALNLNASWYMVRALGGFIAGAVGTEFPSPVFPEWCSAVPMSESLPILLVSGVRITASADHSLLRNLVGLVCLACGFFGLLRSLKPLPGTLLGAILSIVILAYALICDVVVLVGFAVLCLYALGIFLLCSTMGQNTFSTVIGITAVALGTMHLGISYEVYFVALQNIAGGVLPLSGALHSLAAYDGLEKRICLQLVNVVANSFG